jgi:hypothetical protein
MLEANGVKLRHDPTVSVEFGVLNQVLATSVTDATSALADEAKGTDAEEKEVPVSGCQADADRFGRMMDYRLASELALKKSTVQQSVIDVKEMCGESWMKMRLRFLFADLWEAVDGANAASVAKETFPEKLKVFNECRLASAVEAVAKTKAVISTCRDESQGIVALQLLTEVAIDCTNWTAPTIEFYENALTLIAILEKTLNVFPVAMKTGERQVLLENTMNEVEMTKWACGLSRALDQIGAARSWTLTLEGEDKLHRALTAYSRPTVKCPKAVNIEIKFGKAEESQKKMLADFKTKAAEKFKEEVTTEEEKITGQVMDFETWRKQPGKEPTVDETLRGSKMLLAKEAGTYVIDILDAGRGVFLNKLNKYKDAAEFWKFSTEETHKKFITDSENLNLRAAVLKSEADIAGVLIRLKEDKVSQGTAKTNLITHLGTLETMKTKRLVRIRKGPDSKAAQTRNVWVRLQPETKQVVSLHSDGRSLFKYSFSSAGGRLSICKLHLLTRHFCNSNFRFEGWKGMVYDFPRCTRCSMARQSEPPAGLGPSLQPSRPAAKDQPRPQALGRRSRYQFDSASDC